MSRAATGFSQALDGTWSQYQRETGNWAARRTKFADAVDFVGWYHSKTADTYGVARNDTYNLYLAYYLGWTAYGRGNRGDAGVQGYARATDKMARDYDSAAKAVRQLSHHESPRALMPPCRIFRL